MSTDNGNALLDEGILLHRVFCCRLTNSTKYLIKTKNGNIINGDEDLK